MRWCVLAAVTGSVLVSPALGQVSATPEVADNQEMKAIFEADQAPRISGGPIDWDKVSAQDAERRVRTRALLDEGALATGDDYLRAAFIFQHGEGPPDYLLAHTLAMVAVARGQSEALWIAAATLDRYLQAIGQKQIYGTQFKFIEGSSVTQEPYELDLVSDTLREAIGVPPRNAQEERRKELEAERVKASP